MTDYISQTQALVHKMYKSEQGEPILLSPGQDYLFQTIACKKCNRVHCMCHTRFGKSMDVSLAVLTRITTYPEKWAIVAGQKEKARIIMDYLISHIFDNDFTRDRFVPDKGESWESIRRHRNKDRLTFATDQMDGGKTLLSEVFIGSAKDALGFGAPNVVEDESALIDDKEHALVMRMLGDDPSKNFLIKIGNPFRRNHFLKSYHDPRYLKIVIDCYQSLKEGRISQELIDEMKTQPYFKILYECLFPSATEIDEQGWMNLLTEMEIKIAENRQVEPFGRGRLGVDVARGGGNFNAMTYRQPNYAKLVHYCNESNSVVIAETVQTLMTELGIAPQDVYIDDDGVGHGVFSVLRNKNMPVNAVNNGSQAVEHHKYKNVRAEAYAGKDGVQAWIKQGGKLEYNQYWTEQLTKIPYRKGIDGRTVIMSKPEMLKEGIISPDVADSLALTFAKVKKIGYSGINPAAVLSGEISRPFGGVQPYIPGVG